MTYFFLSTLSYRLYLIVRQCHCLWRLGGGGCDPTWCAVAALVLNAQLPDPRQSTSFSQLSVPRRYVESTPPGGACLVFKLPSECTWEMKST